MKILRQPTLTPILLLTFPLLSQNVVVVSSSQLLLGFTSVTVLSGVLHLLLLFALALLLPLLLPLLLLLLLPQLLLLLLLVAHGDGDGAGAGLFGSGVVCWCTHFSILAGTRQPAASRGSRGLVSAMIMRTVGGIV